MAVNTPSIPLNTFRLITGSLDQGSNTIYQEDLDVASIVLSCAVTNKGDDLKHLTVEVTKSGSSTPFAIVYSASLPSHESFDPFPGKVVLQRNDKLTMSTDATSGDFDVVLSILENANQ